MTILITKARSYAKAIFSLAQKNDQLSIWQEALQILAEVSVLCKKKKLLGNPSIMIAEKKELFVDLVKNVPTGLDNLLKLLAERKKFILLPYIADNYKQLFLSYKNVLEVKVSLASKLNKKQEKHLLYVLEKRYQSEILLQIDIDDALIGGAVMYVGDKVIDVSIKGMLKCLKQNLFIKSIYAKTE